MHLQERQGARPTQRLLAAVAVCLACLLTTDCASLVHRKSQVAPVVGTLIVRADTDDSTRREVAEVVEHLKKATKRFRLVSDETDADYLLFVASLTHGTDGREGWTRTQKVLTTLAGLLATGPGGGRAPAHPGTLKVYMCVKDRGSWRAGPVLSFDYGSTMNDVAPLVMDRAVAWAEMYPPDRRR